MSGVHGCLGVAGVESPREKRAKRRIRVDIVLRAHLEVKYEVSRLSYKIGPFILYLIRTKK